MKLKHVFVCAGLLLAFFTVAFAAAGIDGKWTAEIPGRQGTMTTTFTFKAEGEKLTGSVSGRMGDTAISDGTIKGNDVAFKVVREFNGNTFKMAYKGTLSGDEIKFTRTFEGEGPGGQTPPPVEFTAKRAS